MARRMKGNDLRKVFYSTLLPLVPELSILLLEMPMVTLHCTVRLCTLCCSISHVGRRAIRCGENKDPVPGWKFLYDVVRFKCPRVARPFTVSLCVGNCAGRHLLRRAEDKRTTDDATEAAAARRPMTNLVKDGGRVPAPANTLEPRCWFV